MLLYAITKNGRYVADFSDGSEFTGRKKEPELFYTRKTAAKMAREYGRKFGKGYAVVLVAA